MWDIYKFLKNIDGSATRQLRPGYFLILRCPPQLPHTRGETLPTYPALLASGGTAGLRGLAGRVATPAPLELPPEHEKNNREYRDRRRIQQQQECGEYRGSRSNSKAGFFNNVFSMMELFVGKFGKTCESKAWIAGLFSTSNWQKVHDKRRYQEFSEFC